MKRLFLALACLLLAANFGSSAYAAMVQRLPINVCLDEDLFEEFLGMDYTEENKEYCLKAAYPDDVSSCEQVPEQYAEMKELCFFKGRYCDRISSVEQRKYCEETKAAEQSYSVLAGIGGIIYLLIPLAIIGIIVKSVIDAIRKKITAKKALVGVAVIIALAVVWFVLVVVFCLPPCFIVY